MSIGFQPHLPFSKTLFQFDTPEQCGRQDCLFYHHILVTAIEQNEIKTKFVVFTHKTYQHHQT